MRTPHIPRFMLWVAPLALGLAALLLLCSGSVLSADAAGSTALLPDLVADPPDGISLATDTSTGTPRLLLRFNGYIHNKGPGAVDFRGTRVAPKLSKETEEKVKKAEEKKEALPQSIEEELAASPMKASQRLFTTEVGQEETNIERAHVEEPSSAELVFSSADGHHHWHLQRAAKYSLWNAAKTAESAPAQKVGFCLDDSQHVETSKGPSTPVYADNVAPFRDFCQQYKPNATSLFEGISPGWRDLYDRELAFQWVDASNVLPGEYWLREEVNPLGVIKETGGANVPVYASSPTVIPGFDALAQTAATGNGEANAITLSSKAWNDTATPKYTIVSQPLHGKLSAISSAKVTYTPNAGYAGADSFTFSAADPSSSFPTSPAVATVSLEVGEAGAPSVAIEGAPESMTAGTSVQLSAHVVNDSSTVTWATSAGTITQAGLLSAPAEPPSGGTLTVTATTSKGAKDQRTIKVLPVPPDEPAPESPSPEVPFVGSSAGGGGATPGVQPDGQGGGGVLGEQASTARIAVARPTAVLFGRTIVMTTQPSAPGWIRLSAFLGARRIGSCVAPTPAGRSFTCRVELPKGVALRARIRVQATLRDGKALARSVREAAPVEPMQMGAHGARGVRGASAAIFWCRPGGLGQLH